jgi:hypothetical protein
VKSEKLQAIDSDGVPVNALIIDVGYIATFLELQMNEIITQKNKIG